MMSDMPEKDPSSRVFRICQNIQDGKHCLDTSDILRLLDEEWSHLCRFLRTNLTVRRILLPLHRIRRSHPKAQSDLQTFLQRNRSLSRIILTSQDTEEAEWVKTFIAAISKSPSMKTVEFRRLQVNDSHPDIFLPLKDAVALHTVTTIQVHTTTLASLLDTVQQCSQVKHWKIQGGATSIDAPVFSGDVSVKSMELQGQVWSAGALDSVANITAKNDSVRNLEIQAYVSRNDRKSDPVSARFVSTLGESRLETLDLHHLDWSRVSPVEIVSLARNTRLQNLALHDVSDEQARALLGSTFKSLEVMTISVDWVSVDTLNAAVECMMKSASLVELNIEGSGIPSLKFNRSLQGRHCCLLDSSFRPIQWEIIKEWALQSSLSIDLSYVLRSLNEDDMIQMSYLLAECRNLVSLELFWSSSFSSDCADTFSTALDCNISLMDVTIDKLHPSATERSLKSKSKYVAVRNRVGSLLRTPGLTTSLWPVVFDKRDLSTTFLALRDGALTEDLRQ
uniref:F-box domain-containing protein n=1 Tax=Amphora coffeiformis TaxID=265554 RepID=A0A7S3P3T0_9STRA|mmetsp:Transcript_5346/g.10593  ORF Transcript_5346/g.10593 Transcript_5346/m.10593 type:complete len:507 (+) Transcript_5346:147-1667(+)